LEVAAAGKNSSSDSTAELLEALSADVLQTLEAVQVPAYIVDRHRRVRWQNAASIALVGDLRGQLDASVLAPEDLRRAREAFARKQMGCPHTELEVTVVRSDGSRLRMAVSSVPIKDVKGVMIGSFGVAQTVGDVEPPFDGLPKVSPRERETLTLLAAGYSTAEMAELMSISTETVRNHVKGLLRRLGASSRVEAVAKGRRAGLV
jgi:DNA-binding CsgD family transcriptional regulator